MHEKATVLTTIFTIVDDTMKGSPMIQQTLDRPGPAPRLSDSDVATRAIYQVLICEPREAHFFRLPGASHYDNQAVVELLDSFAHHLKRLLGDGAYNDAALQTFLEQYRSVELLAPVKLNQQPVRSKQAQQQLNRLRLICETVNAQLQEQLHLSKHYAKSTWGLLTRIAAKLTAHSGGMMVNQLVGRPLLRLAELEV